ncbi:GTPase [Georgenia sunbinii]|uniref:GTPase n=1 Tax=Georgenia sunbinii TaxID=3117728 RepID=UPI002F267B1D
MRRRGAAAPTLDARLEQLAAAVRHGEGRVGATALAPARDTLARAGERRGLGPGVTVAALLGATGSGKSSLFNAVAGTPLAAVHVRRPTTTVPLAVSWDAPGSGPLLDWLQVGERREAVADGLAGLVLLDLPDIDSTTAANRQVATRLAERVDALVWVLDPQKYADGVVHEDYLRAMHEHAAVSLIVLNQVDRLSTDELTGVTDHLRTLLEQDGMAGVELLTTSAASGQGVTELRQRLAALAAAGVSAERRLAADARAAAAELVPWSATGEVPAEVPAGDEGDLVTACAAAAGAGTVVDAVARSYRQRAARHVGWPPLRWLSRLRPDPLHRLHLDAPTNAVTSLPGPTPAQAAAVRTAVDDLARTVTTGFAEPWRGAVVTGTQERVPELVATLDGAVAGTDLGAQRRPAWWRAWQVTGLLIFLTAVAGAGWLGVLAGLGYLQLPAPETPMLGALPWPTALLIGGLVLGLVLALLGRVLARVGARRASRRARHRLEAAIRSTVRQSAVAPLDSELTRYRYFTDAARAAAT